MVLMIASASPSYTITGKPPKVSGHNENPHSKILDGSPSIDKNCE